MSKFMFKFPKGDKLIIYIFVGFWFIVFLASLIGLNIFGLLLSFGVIYFSLTLKKYWVLKLENRTLSLWKLPFFRHKLDVSNVIRIYMEPAVKASKKAPLHFNIIIKGKHRKAYMSFVNYQELLKCLNYLTDVIGFERVKEKSIVGAKFDRDIEEWKEVNIETKAYGGK